MLLQHVKGIDPDAELITEYDELNEQINRILDQMSVILEAPVDSRMAANSAIDRAPIPRGAMGGRDGSRGRGTGPGEDVVSRGSRVPSGAMGSGEDIKSHNDDGRMPAPGQVESGETMDEVIQSMEQVTKQMDAAKRGLSLVNKLPQGKSRGDNASRIMGNMNRIRGNLRRIEKALNSFINDAGGQ